MSDLPKDFIYIERCIPIQSQFHLFETLLEEINWEEKEITLYGKTMKQPRLVAWYGDMDYTYSGQINKKQAFTPTLERLKEKVEQHTNTKFNSVLANLYRNGQDSMGKHSDDEPELGNKPVIASLSLGETRRFIIRHKQTKEKWTLELEPGSLLIMKGKSQEEYTHELPKTKQVKGPRINLTFRYIH